MGPGRMKSTRVEFARFRNLGIGCLRAGDEYLRTVANYPVQVCAMAIDQRPFNKLLRKLRYGAVAEQDRQEALRSICALSTDFLGLRQDPGQAPAEESQSLLTALEEGAGDLQQVDLVANAAELSALPFEAALAADGTPLFLGGGGVVLTRRVRGRFNEAKPAWPPRPRAQSPGSNDSDPGAGRLP